MSVQGVKFNATSEEMELVAKIAERAGCTGAERMDLMMELEAVHCNGTPLDFEKLLSFPTIDFFHDIAGIGNHLVRTTGKLADSFLPRCAKKRGRMARE